MRRVATFFLMAWMIVTAASPTRAQQKKVATPATRQPAAKLPAKEADTKQSATKEPAAKEPETKQAAVKGASEEIAGLLRYIPDEVVVVAAMQPARVIKARKLRSLIDSLEGQDVLDEIFQKTLAESGFSPDQVEEIGIFLDKKTFLEIAAAAEKQADTTNQINSLRQLGLAMHNFHDTYNMFPDDDGYGDNKGNLSWRVHLLPFLGEAALYNDFDLDEPWDSEHNKALIERMPDLFASPDVEDAGKTSIHVMTGEGTPFGGDDEPRMRDIFDGTSNTLLTVIAGPDKAEVWTKPGGLEIDVEDPVAALGKVDSMIIVGFMDGSVRPVANDTDPTDLLHLIQHQDGVPIFSHDQGFRQRNPQPGVVVRYTAVIDQESVLKRVPSLQHDAKPVEIEGHSARLLYGRMLVVFPNPNTMLFGSEITLKEMLRKRLKSGTTKSRFESLYPSNDAAAVVDMEQLQEQEQFQEMIQQTPIAGLLGNIMGATGTIDFTGKADSLLHIEIQTGDEADAAQLSGLANGGYQMLKAQALGTASRDDSPIAEKLVEVMSELLDSVAIDADDSTLLLDMPKPDNVDQLLEDITPALKEVMQGIRAGREVARKRGQLNSLKQIGLAFHNYHDVYNGLPSYNTARSDKGENKGLSWRVHLLPYLEEAELYNEFHLDEPWDSEHNKKLIPRMPKLFECDGVDKPGYTSYHVFTGENTPAGGAEPAGIRDITDGTSNTILAVQAGPDTAEVWTKPSGLEFDSADPKKALGKIGEQFMVLMCDGYCRFVDSDIDETTLSHLIQQDDGNPIGEF